MHKRIFAPFVLFYLRFFAKVQLRKINPIVIGVGGASGKTSTVLLISQILSVKYTVKQSKGKNSETGIPLNILDIEMGDYTFMSWIKAVVLCPVKIVTNWKKYDYYVVEMGIDSPTPPKNMEYLLRIIKPSIGVLTNINLEHSLYFDSLVKSEADNVRKKEILDLLAKEEHLLLQSIDENGYSVINLDDPNILSLLPLKSKTITVSKKSKDADFYISEAISTIEGSAITFTYLSEKYKININNPLPTYYSYSFVFAVAVAFLCKVNVREAVENISKNFSLPPGRFSKFNGIKNTVIFDSSYNSSFESAKGALEMISKISSNERKLGILGDMRELGSMSKIQHELLAREILKNLDTAILIGPMMVSFVAPILQKENFDFMVFQTFSDARNDILNKVKNGDVILVKGSQNTLFLERAVEMLLLDKKDKEKLCRRGDFWDKKRREK